MGNKILHINSYYITGSFYKNLYDSLITYDFELDVFVPVYKNQIKNDFDRGNYTTISINHKKWHRFFFNLKQQRIIDDVQKQYNLEKYDIIHAHTLFTNGNVALSLKKKYDTPYIVAVRNTDINVFFKKMKHLRKRGVDILKHSEKIIFISKSYRDYTVKEYIPYRLQQTIMQKVIVIPNGIDEFWLSNLARPKKLEDSKKVNLLFIGTVDKNKNLLTTLNSVDSLKRKGYKVEYTVVGRIVDSSIYNKIVDNPSVTYMPFMPKEDLIKIYRENHIFVMPSITETFGIVYPEAMSQGLPVIYSKGQGFDGFFNNGIVGYSVDSMDSDSIVLAIEKIIDNYTHFSKQAIENSKIFNWNDIANQYESIYKEIVIEKTIT